MRVLPLILFLALVPVFFFALYEEKEEIPSPLIGQQIPDFLLPDLTGEGLLDRNSVLGEVFVLNIWGSWCPSCYVEHPFLKTLSERGVKIVGVDYKDTREAGQNFLTKLGNPFQEVIFDEQGGFGLDLGVYGAPESYLIDKDGTILHKRVGVLDERVWNEQFEALWQAARQESRQAEKAE